MKLAIETCELTKFYHKTRGIENLNLHVEEGEVFGFIGPNGALRDNPDVENYLHEAALVANTPSGTAYYNGNGERVENLGVHEHWNNSQDKQYSRNLGASEGIELIYLGSDK